MNLVQMRQRVRDKILDPSGDRFVDADINDALNEALEWLLSTTGALVRTWQKTWTAGRQEFALPADFQQLKHVSYYANGIEMPLDPSSPDDEQSGEYSSGRPEFYYLRGYTNERVEMSASGLTVNPTDSTQDSYRFNLGLSPVPDAAYVVSCTYYRRAPEMKLDGDSPPVGPEHHKTLIDYAIALFKEADGFMDDAEYYYKKAGAEKDKLELELKRGKRSGLPRRKMWDEDGSRMRRSGRPRIYIGMATN